jgi:predicted membrane channel-forming protein YqfA (hemolysin III family)
VTEPVSSAVGGFAIGKALTAIAGFFGGLSVSFFWQPKKLHQYGKLAAGAIIGGIAVAASITLGGIISHYMGVDVNNSDAALAIGYVIGVMSVFVLSILVNFFEKKEGKDIFEVASEMKSMKNNFGKSTQKRRRK